MDPEPPFGALKRFATRLRLRLAGESLRDMTCQNSMKDGVPRETTDGVRGCFFPERVASHTKNVTKQKIEYPFIWVTKRDPKTPFDPF